MRRVWGLKSFKKITKIRSKMPDGSTWKLRFSTDQQFRKYRNYRICLLLFRDKSKGKKVKAQKKKRQLKTERINTAKTSRRASPHRSPRARFGGCCPPTWSDCCRQHTRSHLGRGKALFTHHCRRILQPEPGHRAG